MNSLSTVVIATRESPLALWQAEHIAARLRRLQPSLKVELLGMTTQGDQLLDRPLSRVGGKGLFIKELEQAMLDGRAHLAVHSMKDVTVELPAGFCLAAICQREDPRDAFVSNTFKTVDDLPVGARVGTASLRRSSQLKALRPDLEITPLRGNVNTRLRKLDSGEFDAIVLASAGLTRLEMGDRIASHLSPLQCLPAPGQGALGLECPSENTGLRDLLARLGDPQTTEAVRAERALNRRLDGGCSVPIAAYATHDAGELWLRGLVGAVDGSRVLRAEGRAPADQATQLGEAVAQQLLDQGAAALLASIH